MSRKISVDLTTLAGYTDLPDGTYNIRVKAKADGYADSDFSESVNYTKNSYTYIQQDGTIRITDAPYTQEGGTIKI